MKVWTVLSWVVATFFACLIAFAVLAIMVTFVYFAFTGGTTYTDHTRIGGVECIQVRNRFTNGVKSVSCPPVRAR